MAKKILVSVLLALGAATQGVNAAESKLAWNTVEAGVGALKLSSPGINVDSTSAWGLSASSLLTEGIYSQVSYSRVEFDYGIEARSNSVALGTRWQITDTTDLFTEIGSDLSTVEAPGLKSSERTTVYSLGVKSLIASNFEVTASATRYDGDIGYGASGLYMITKTFGIRLGYSKSESEGNSSKGTTLSAVFRF